MTLFLLHADVGALLLELRFCTMHDFVASYINAGWFTLSELALFSNTSKSQRLTAFTIRKNIGTNKTKRFRQPNKEFFVCIS